MAVACPTCGKASRDPEFCEYCRTDLRPTVVPQPPLFCPLGDNPVPLNLDHLLSLTHPDAGVYLATGDEWWRVHWLDARAEPEWHQAWQQRQEVAAPGLPLGHTAVSSRGLWIFTPSVGASSTPWIAADRVSPIEHLRHLVAFVADLTDLLEDLHRRGFFWMNFDPAELERGADGQLRITNLDVRLFAHGRAPHTLAVHEAYAAPEIVYLNVADLGPRTDVFHLSAFCYYWLARRLPGGLPGEGLEAVDFHLPPLRIYAPEMPEGIAAVLTRGMSPEARHRFATPRQFLEHLREAAHRAEARRAFTGSVRFDLGSHSRTGRSKTALGRANEDQAFVRRYIDPERILLMVADGITTCDIGNGALASLIATIVVENELDRMTDPAEFAGRIGVACARSSQTLLDWAMEKGYRDQLREGRDLMGSTLTVGWLNGSSVQIANLGDSRAYLITDHRIEQLTVDGDLASDLLSHGTPPEQVRELGLMTKALRKCIGGCELDPEGRIDPMSDSSIPTLSEWQLLPGDILVLCTDGLVEEGAFLEPEILVEIVRNHPSAGAQELADLFAEAADALQRVPSPQEPDGFGDNVSCVVVRVLPGT